MCTTHFLCTRRSRMVPFIWLEFQIWFVWASPGFVHSDDSSKKVVTFPIAPVQQGLCDCVAVSLLHLGNFIGYPKLWKFAVTRNVVQNVEHSFVTYSYFRAVHRRSASIREARSLTVFFSTWGRPVRRLSWTASLPSRNALIHRATVRYGNTAQPHASRSPWKHYCVLRPRLSSILIQVRCSSFINRVFSLLAAETHLTVLVRVHKAGSSRTHYRHVTAVLPVLFIQPLYIWYVFIFKKHNRLMWNLMVVEIWYSSY